MLFHKFSFCRIHQSIDITPAMVANITDALYDMEWIVDRVTETEPKPRVPRPIAKGLRLEISR